MLPLGGIFIAIFVGWVMKKENVLEELDIEENLIFKFWYFSIRYRFPARNGWLCLSLLFYLIYSGISISPSHFNSLLSSKNKVIFWLV